MLLSMKRYTNPKATLRFIVITLTLAAAVQLVLNLFTMDDNQAEPSAPSQQLSAVDAEKPRVDLGLKIHDLREIRQAYAPLHTVERPEILEDILDVKEEPQTKSVKIKTVYGPVPETVYEGGPRKIAIIIDDMGMNRVQSRAVMDLDVPLTLAFLPYAPGLKQMTREARTLGYELMIHMPMEPMDGKQDLGSISLREDMEAETWLSELNKAFESFDGYVGLNNHMGSRLTQNPEAMSLVMDTLKTRGLYFVDSRTISTSIAGEVAHDKGLDMAIRDVFLDHENSIDFVRGALLKAERVAARKGHAIVIGHPKAATVQGLQEWLPTLGDKGIEIVPASDLVRSKDDGLENPQKGPFNLAQTPSQSPLPPRE